MLQSGKITARDKMEKVYFDMLETTHYSKITVSDIISKAGVSRTTFYRHYVDIFDMHEKVADRFASSIIEMCIKKVVIEGVDVYDELVKVFIGQDKYILLISGKNGSRFFFEAIYHNAMKYLLPVFGKFSEETEFRLRFIAVAAIGVYVRNILENREHNTEFIEVCKKLVDLKLHGGNYGD